MRRKKQFQGIEEILNSLPDATGEAEAGKNSDIRGIHVECNEEAADEIFRRFRLWTQERGREAAYILRTDQGYERDRVGEYVNFFRRLAGCGRPLSQVLKQFGLWELRRRHLRSLKPGEKMLVNLARVSTQPANLYFLENPLRNLDAAGVRAALTWMEERMEQGALFVTLHASMKQALLIPGLSFYADQGMLWQQEQDTQEEAAEEELTVQKIAAHENGATLLFDPKDIDYIESVCKSNYLSVRGSAYQVSQTLDELEEALRKSGFFRCHRSYIVNVQKVERMERFTKNSFVLILNNAEHSQIPLAKGRVEEMKNAFHW